MGIPILDPKKPGAAELAGRAGICALTVMAKVPRPGAVKTRLSPPLTPEEAAELNLCFLRDTTENIAAVVANETTLGHRVAGLIAYTPVGDEAFFEGKIPDGFALVAQRGHGFGERLLAAAEDVLACGYSSVCLIDSDSPTVPREAYELAVAELARPGDRIVLGPAADGGYYLIGLKQPHTTVFERIHWSTETVAADTRERAREAQIELVELPLWYDVDDNSTLDTLRAELLADMAPGFATLPGYAAPHTREFLLSHDAVSNAVLWEDAPDATAAETRDEDPLERTL